MDPVGYRRINKRTGKEVGKDDIVRGVKVGEGDYVVLGDDEIAAAYPRTTQTIEIEHFVAPAQIPFTLLDRPYYLEPVAKGEKVYALLREALRAAGVVGLARLVLHTKEHLAVLVPAGPALLLDTLRWPADVRPWTELNLPAEGRAAAKLKGPELDMAARLIESMTEDFDPARYADRFGAAVQALVEQRAKAGKTEAVEPMEDAPGAAGNVIDLTELLKRSLKGGRTPASRPAAKMRPARKRA
jgi:DNA end-binding protein Ku